MKSCVHNWRKTNFFTSGIRARQNTMLSSPVQKFWVDVSPCPFHDRRPCWWNINTCSDLYYTQKCRPQNEMKSKQNGNKTVSKQFLNCVSQNKTLKAVKRFSCMFSQSHAVPLFMQNWSVYHVVNQTFVNQPRRMKRYCATLCPLRLVLGINFAIIIPSADCAPTQQRILWNIVIFFRKYVFVFCWNFEENEV